MNLTGVLVFVVFGCVLVQGANLPVECGNLQAPPRVPPIDTTGWELEQVSIVFRHGDRIMYQDRTCWPHDEGVFECQDRHLSTPSFWNNQTTSSSGRLYRKSYLNNRNYYAGTCETGQLTNRGFIQEFRVGQMYRDVYINSGFLSPNIEMNTTYLRSDEADRCIQSLEVLLEGMYPQVSSPEPVIYNIYTMDSYYDNITPNSNICPMFATYKAAALQTPSYQTFFENQVVPLYSNLTEVLGFNVDSSGDIEQIHDCLIVHACHEQPIPQGAEASTLLYKQVMEVFDYSYSSIYNYPTPQENAQVGIGFFLQEITQLMVDKMNGDSPVKLAMYSAHDTTVLPILAAYQQWNGVWAPYASQLQIEMYKNNAGDRAIRMAYNGKNILVPGCSGVLCDWNDFYSYTSSLFPADPPNCY